jgi:tripartite-type tricarboxylate transporter receptor subunit TctC
LPNILVVHPAVPTRSIPEFITFAKASPGKLSYASGLVGTSPQLSMEWFKLVAKIDVVHIPYKIGSQGVPNTLAGQVPMGVFNLPVSVAPVQAGCLQPLAVTSVKRAPPRPDVPTIQETGYAGFEVNSWYGVCAPGGTPVPLLDKLNADIGTVMRIPEFHQRMAELVMDATPISRDEFDQFIRTDIARWAQVIKDAKIPLQ